MSYSFKVTGAMIGLWILLTASCVAPLEPPAPPMGSCSLALPSTASDEEAVRAMLTAEGELVVEQNIDALMKLWGAGSKIIDAKNTPDNDQDDQAWLDKDAIRHRYVRTVFPGAPAQAAPKDLQLQIVDNRAIVAATTQIGAEVSPAGDRWILIKAKDCWEIQSLTYNLEAK